MSNIRCLHSVLRVKCWQWDLKVFGLDPWFGCEYSWVRSRISGQNTVQCSLISNSCLTKASSWYKLQNQNKVLRNLSYFNNFDQFSNIELYDKKMTWDKATWTDTYLYCVLLFEGNWLLGWFNFEYQFDEKWTTFKPFILKNNKEY